jgi:hypothetical protein
MARRAGITQAASATVRRVIVMAANVATSDVGTPYRKPASDRAVARPPARPMTIPAPASSMPSRTTSRNTFRASAPSARRMPISRVRREIENESRP